MDNVYYTKIRQINTLPLPCLSFNKEHHPWTSRQNHTIVTNILMVNIAQLINKLYSININHFR
jgi:hypothetical protein